MSGSAVSGPAPQTSVTLVLPTYNRCDVVEKTLRHYLAQDYPAELLEVIVADNSTDGTPQMVARIAAEAPFPIWCQRSTERLPAVKRNLALRAARGELVMFMNDDVWIAPDCVRRHVDAHARHDAPVAVVGYVEQSTQMPFTPFCDWYRPFAYAEMTGGEVGYRYHWSMNLSLPRAVLLDRDLVFHEDWANIGHEDIELGYRWTQAGYPVVFEPGAVGEHYHPHSLDSACRLQYSIGRGLRDLEKLIAEPDLLERYGVLSAAASPRGRVRMTVRNALFNRISVPPLQARLGRLQRRNPVADWLYWKVLMHHTERGYRDQGPREPRPTATRPTAARPVQPARAAEPASTGTL